MNCSNPKIIAVNVNGDIINFLIPCGKCYACQQRIKSEWVTRLSYECEGCHVAFLTLTYDDEHVPVMSGFSRQDVYDATMNHKAYDMCRIWKPDSSLFLMKLRRDWRNFTGRKDLLRYVLNFEYGDTNSRPHGHCILIFPPDVSRETYISYMEHLGTHPYNDKRANNVPRMHFAPCIWDFGNITSQYVYEDIRVNETSALSAYVSKHCTKTCTGTQKQNTFAPIFRKTSKFGGGIGINQMLSDANVIDCYESGKPLVVYGKDGTPYKVAVPRSVKRRLHPQNLTLNEAFDLSRQLFTNEKKSVDTYARSHNIDDFNVAKENYYKDLRVDYERIRADVNRRRIAKHNESMKRRNQ